MIKVNLYFTGILNFRVCVRIFQKLMFTPLVHTNPEGALRNPFLPSQSQLPLQLHIVLGLKNLMKFLHGYLRIITLSVQIQ